MTFPVCTVGIPIPLTGAGRLQFSNGYAKPRRALPPAPCFTWLTGFCGAPKNERDACGPDAKPGGDQGDPDLGGSVMTTVVCSCCGTVPEHGSVSLLSHRDIASATSA